MRYGDERHEGCVLARTIEIGPEVCADDLDLQGFEVRAQIVIQCFCPGSRHLVLDRDMRPPGLHVLWADPGQELTF